MRTFAGSLSSFRFSTSFDDTSSLIALGLSQDDAETFQEMIKEAALRKENLFNVNWNEYQPIKIDGLTQFDRLPEVKDEFKVDILNKFAVLKLNGGVGSTMGLKRPKALLVIKHAVIEKGLIKTKEQNFLTAAVDQVVALNETFKGLQVPLVLMNSFATHEQTMAALKTTDNASKLTIHTFLQRKFPRLNPSSLKPIPASKHATSEAWYPPGHGDVFETIVTSGVAEQLIAAGKEYAFISNIDNPGANLDPRIAQHIVNKGRKLLLEFTERTPNDQSGGVLVDVKGKRICLELSQVPDANLPQFGSLEYSAFNTNNLWVHLPTLVRVVKDGQLKLSGSSILRELDSEVLRRLPLEARKHINPDMIKEITEDPRKTSFDVLQIENTAASIFGSFPHAEALAVSRKRWRVIKTTADLLMVRADGLLELQKGHLVVGEKRRIPALPNIKWGKYFRNLKELEERIPFSPDILDLVHLSVEGDVRFGRNVKLAGTVILIATGDQRLIIPDNAILRDNIMIGELSITPH